MTLVKICGITSRDALEATAAAGADMAGFVVFPPSPRHLSVERLSEFGAIELPALQKVLLTVEADDATLDACVKALKPDLLQLHGSESPARAQFLRARHRLPIIKALGVAQKTDLQRASAYRGCADILLLDAKPSPDMTRPGGNGMVFDWSLLTDFHYEGSWILSGGLTPENVREALRISGAPGVDASSGVEMSPGVKDADKIKKFVMAAKRSVSAP